MRIHNTDIHEQNGNQTCSQYTKYCLTEVSKFSHKNQQTHSAQIIV